ncbi:MAG: SusC/RagA family TonB-linked outer membrane protein [Chitinophagaceae bacterium]|nr:SusC/RagA family TonB-linked outer membrane protein [Chitinophagaceae bacterium]
MKRWKAILFFTFVLSGLSLSAQVRTIRGKITSATDNAPVVAASVQVKGSNTGTVTDNDGNFSLSLPPGKQTLVISNIGFDPIEKILDEGETQLNISLTENRNELGGVIVTALGISRQAKTLVYATQTVKPAELVEARDPNNLINSLQGKIANAVVTQGSGGPGSGSRIVLRGTRSIQGSNNALIVVDGVPINNSTNGRPSSDFGGVQGSDGASNINPDDIASMTVLRGPSAAALYGSQAGNGVIVITTKQGTKDKVSVNLNSGIVSENVVGLPAVQNEYGQGNSGVIDVTSGDSWGPKMDGSTYTSYHGTEEKYSPQPDNIKDFFRNGISTNNSIGITGGGEKTQAYVSYTHNYVQGILPRNDLTRHTVNVRVGNKIGKRFSTDSKITYIIQDIKSRPTGGPGGSAFQLYQIPRSVPTADASHYENLDAAGIPVPAPFPASIAALYQNPYWLVNRASNNEARNRIIGFLTAKFQITDWLNIAARGNLDRTVDNGENSVFQGTLSAKTGGGNFSVNTITKYDKWFDVILEGSNNITADLAVKYHVGGIMQDSRFISSNTSSNGLNVTNKFSMNFARAPSVGSSFSKVLTHALFGQVNFSYRDMLYLDASLRNDWDSRLPDPFSYQYPSVGVSAILSDMLNLPRKISFLKVSANYAQVGNGGQFGLLNAVYFYDQGAGGGFLQRGLTFPIPDLKPEIVKNLEFGAEARFVDNRIGFTATYYKSNSYNQLLQVDLPVASGYANQYINAGNIQNTGFELVLSGSPVNTSRLQWDISLNAAFNKNKVVSLSDDVKIFYLGGGFGRSATPVVIEGEPYGQLLGFKWATDAKGNRVVAADGKPILSEEQEYIGNYNPKATFGFTNTVNFNDFFIRALVDGRVGGTVVSGTEMNLAFSGIPEVTKTYREGNWNLGGVDADGQAVGEEITAQDFWQTASSKDYGAGEFFAYDATNFRLREMTLGYQVPIKRSKIIQNARVSLVGRNLFFIYRGKSKMDIPGLGKRKMKFDPDMTLGNGNWQGVEYGAIPSTRSLGVNLQLTF